MPQRGGADLRSLGLRNPWKWSLDRATGEQCIGDVGETALEEVDHVGGSMPAVADANLDGSVYHLNPAA